MVISVLVPLGAGALGPLMVADLDLSTAAFGVLGSAFYAGAALSSRRGAHAVRALGPRRALSLWYGAQMLTLVAVGLVGDRYPLLLALFFLNGAGSAAVTPAANTAIASFRRFRGFAVGLVQSGVPAASLLAGAIVAPLAQDHGWRQVLALAGIVGLVPLVTGVLFLRRTNGATRPSVDRRAAPERRGSVATLNLRWTAVCTFLNAVGVAPMYLYSVLYLASDLGGDPVQAARLYALAGLLGVVARWVWGIVYQRPHHQRTSFVTMAVGAAVVPMLMAAATDETRWLAALAVLAIGFCAAWMVLVNAAIVEATSADLTTSTGLVYTVYFGGLLVSAPLFGAIVDVTGSYRFAWLISVLTLSLAAVLVCSGRLWCEPAAARSASAPAA